jgi:hypothetical protein
MDSLTIRPVPGTEGATDPFWSPDSRYLGFTAGAKLKKVDVTGGTPEIISDLPSNGAVHGIKQTRSCSLREMSSTEFRPLVAQRWL